MVIQSCNICWIWWMNGNFSVKLLQSLFSHQRNMWSHAILVDMLVKFFIINSGWISLIAVFSWSKSTKYLFKWIIYFYKRLLWWTYFQFHHISSITVFEWKVTVGMISGGSFHLFQNPLQVSTFHDPSQFVPKTGCFL